MPDVGNERHVFSLVSFTAYFFVFLNSRYRTASGHHDCSSTVRWYNNTTTTHFFKLALASFKKDEAKMLENQCVFSRAVRLGCPILSVTPFGLDISHRGVMLRRSKRLVRGRYVFIVGVN